MVKKLYTYYVELETRVGWYEETNKPIPLSISVVSTDEEKGKKKIYYMISPHEYKITVMNLMKENHWYDYNMNNRTIMDRMEIMKEELNIEDEEELSKWG